MMYHCCDPARRERVLEAISDGVAINGIDFLEVLDREAPIGVPRQQTLLLTFLGTAPDLLTENIELTGGERITGIEISWVTRADLPDPALVEPSLVAWLATLPNPERTLVIRTDQEGDFSTYTLSLVSTPGAISQPAGIDYVLSLVGFSFKVECPTDYDCKPVQECSTDVEPPPEISYLSKDYQSFRGLMLDRMAQIMPDWRERSPADIGITLVEMLAYTADRLSYAQDAVATESYLSTARRRTSVKRHARLVDYFMHDGANARVWVHLDTIADSVTIPQGTPFLTRAAGFDPVISDPNDIRDARATGALVFEALHEKTLFADHNQMFFYDWGNAECCLARGATRATLAGDFPNLALGDVLVFEERLGPRTGAPADADPETRHAVQLTAVQAGLTDTLTGTTITEIRWADEDALPFAFCLSSRTDDAAGGRLATDVSHVLGNVLLADHGARIEAEDIGSVPQPHLRVVPDDGDTPCDRPDPVIVPARYRPTLAERPVTQSAPHDPGAASAHAHIQVSRGQRRAAVSLTSGALPDVENWSTRRDLLQSFAGSLHFVVETEENGAARLRFGDGTNGARAASGTAFTADYRVGNGRRGNVGRDAIRHIVSGLTEISTLRNPLPALGGVDPETADEARQAAPYAYRRQERAVTEDDYAMIARRYPDVQRAAATFRWNGHGHTVFVTVDRFGGRPVTPEFKAGLIEFLDMHRMAGYGLKIDAPRFVPLEIGLFVCADPDHFRSQVRVEILHRLGTGTLTGGQPAFFHPDNFSFAEPLHLSAIYAAVMEIKGVSSVEATWFRRRGSTDPAPLQDGVLTFGRLEIAQLENTPNFPERGSLDIKMGGGK